MPLRYTGRVHEFDNRAGYGYVAPDPGLDLPTDELILVHRYSLRDRATILETGDRVNFALDTVPRGLLATDCYVLPPPEPEQTPSPEENLEPNTDTQLGLSAAQEILSQAILARDRRDHKEAARLYGKGLRECPTVQLVLSYAAMEKNRNRKQDAMRIYLEGIRRFASNPKLREDAGVLAASLGDYPKAVRLLQEALELAKQTGAGIIGVLLALARTSYQMDNVNALRSSVKYYEEASKGYKAGRTMPASDLLDLNLARIRTQHHRGSIAFNFLRDSGFKIFKAALLGQHTEGADFFVQQVHHPELTESYSLANQLLVRCFFKSSISLSDLTRVDETVFHWAESDLIDEQVALIMVGALSDEIQRLLFSRLEDKRKASTAIVPITQADIEGSPKASDAFRGVLDRWLYRRDLFAGNLPVVGRRFFGREKSLAGLRDAIATSTAAGIFGLRKVGKSSLVQECRRRSTETGDICVYLDLLKIPAEISDCRWLYWKIADSLYREIQSHAHRNTLREFRWRLGGQFLDYLDVPETFQVGTAFDSDLTRLIEFLRAAGLNPRPKVVLLLDEVERLLPTSIGKPGFAGFFDFVSYLRGLSQESDGFVVIVTAANAAITEAPQFDGRDNPVFNFFREIYLPYLEFSECSQMIRVLGRGMGLRFDPQASNLVFKLTGGHPFFTRQLCSFIAESHRQRPLEVTGDIVKSIIDRYLDVRWKDLHEIMERLKRDFPDEHKVCSLLARAGGQLALESVRKLAGNTATLRHLTGYQIVTIQGSMAAISMDLLTRWIKKRELSRV